MQVNSDILFMVEGLNQQGLAVCWGDGFAVDSSQISQFTGAASAAPFLDALLLKPYAGNVIISVHYYGPSISKNTNRWLAQHAAAHDIHDM